MGMQQFSGDPGDSATREFVHIDHRVGSGDPGKEIILRQTITALSVKMGQAFGSGQNSAGGRKL